MKTTKPKRGDTCRIFVARVPTLGRIVAEIEAPGKPSKYRVLAENRKTYSREASGILTATDGDRERLTAILAEK